MKKVNKGGRPSTEIKRDKEKRILFTKSEFKQLEIIFKESIYVNMNDMIRDILLKNEYRVVALDKDLLNHKNLLLEECKRIGNNFNQMIKLFNQKKLNYFTKEEIQKMIFNIEEIKKLYINIEHSFKNDSKN
jgi:hypothetical protein